MNSSSIKVAECDWFFMSYHEPNANSHWTDLVQKVPWAQRVDGIKGFDAVHRYCGTHSNTEWLVTIDADTTIYPKFLEEALTIYPNGAKNFCWASKNNVNGLVYGNGGIKLWHKPFVSKMAFHELGSGMDFCWDKDYQQLGKLYSDVTITGSAYQAFRAGYREGVKLSTLKGVWVDPMRYKDLPVTNKRLLSIWTSLGMDIEFGDYAVLGARCGVIDNIKRAVKEKDIINFDFIDARLDALNLKTRGDRLEALDATAAYVNEHSSFKVFYFNPTQSAFIKENFTLSHVNYASGK